MAAGEELLALIDGEIPEGRTSLQENFMNLENVAKYCEENYQRANPNEKYHALQETKNYTTHSLASVAYQINNLATNFLKLLDLQQSELTNMESSVNHLNQIVMIHKEKVARREIGVLTSSRNVPRPLGMKDGIIYPEQRERPIKYTRKQIDYSALDDIGHGVRQQGQASTPRTARSPSISSTHSNMSNTTNNNQAPTSKPPTPPIVYKAGGVGGGAGSGGGGTIGRAGGGHYRSLGPPVAPPVAPNTPPISAPAFQQPGNNANYPPAFPPPSSRSSVSSGGSYSPSGTLVMGAIHSPPVLGGMGMAVGPPPDGYHGFPPHHTPAAHNLTRPMAPPLMQHHHDPMVHPRNSSSSIRGHNMIASPPPPPPPAADLPDQFEYGGAPPPPPDFSDDREGPPSMRAGVQQQPLENDIYGTAMGMGDDPYAATGPQFLSTHNAWVPKHYLEKVVAIYDYQANKADELSFAENAIVYVIHKNDDGWWEGVMNGQTGLFPYNYVEPCI